MLTLLILALLGSFSSDAADINLEKGDLSMVWSDTGCENTNIALQGRATQSSVYTEKHNGSYALAMNAIDGNTDTDLFHGSCMHTNCENDPWWRVDLLGCYKISKVVVTNRGAHGSRLNGAEIRIGNSLGNNGNNNPRCAVISSLPDGFTQTYMCRNMVGRYVNIHIPGRKECLHVCEVQVFGVPA
ncbi:fucolectin-like [Bombina bombina]|uniref:fucolectin-like n=1 Tax=Bombina bombina TaxID=8345 RepID=UPI00235A8649|nr:fucolectin-like [Bombina bombina]